MQRFSLVVRIQCLTVVVASSLMATSSMVAAEFAVPPQAERDAVAAIAKHGGRAQINGDYRVISLLLGQDTTNEDLKLLANCEQLTQLSLNCPNVTDAGLDHLKSLKKLTSITVNRSGISAAGLAALRAALPDCRITSLNDQGRGGVIGGFGGGPGGGFGGGPGGSLGSSRTTSLVRNTAIQDELKLTPEQRSQITAATSSAALAALAKALDEKVLATLTPEQQARLKQLELQQGGISSLLRDDVSAQLKLTDEQKATVRKVGEAATAEARAAVSEIIGSRGEGPVNAEIFEKLREKTAEINKARDEKSLAVLSDEQRKAWETMVGPKGPIVASFGDRIPAGERGGFGPVTDPAATAKAVFDRYDTDKSNTLTDAEFPATNRSRSAMTRAGVMLVFPMSRDDFEKAYVKYAQDFRRRE